MKRNACVSLNVCECVCFFIANVAATVAYCCCYCTCIFFPSIHFLLDLVWLECVPGNEMEIQDNNKINDDYMKMLFLFLCLF